ncbi:MAG: hypothetical protein V7K40_03765 [Nostoc sp.]|uniref:hypothetical protein n=1 Tax=Nostoc sp. TaxID=1180 RepID=UPI002FF74FB6
MHHSLKIKIWDLDHIESIVEQDITDVEAEKIVGGTLSVSKSQVVLEKTVGGTLSVIKSQLVSLVDPKTLECGTPPIPDPPLPPCIVVPIISSQAGQISI